MTKAKKKNRLLSLISEKFRIIVVNESLEEKYSIKLSALNLLVVTSLLGALTIIATTLVIIYTPLRQYILGFSETDMKHKIVEMTFKMDSLQNKISQSDTYLQAIQKSIRGEIKAENINDSYIEEKNAKELEDIDISPSQEELKLRQDVEEIEKFNTFNSAKSSSTKMIFFSPISGDLSTIFSQDKRHFGVDVVAREGEPVKAVGDGTVVFSEWSSKTGYVIMIQHANNFISVYKHNSFLTKRQGDMVKAGEVIAAVGNTGEITTGSHLHFELWDRGYPVDPFNFVSFR